MAKKNSSGPRGARKRGQHKPAKPASKARRSFTLANLQPPAGSRKKKVRVGPRMVQSSQDRRRRQQRAEVATRLFAPPRLEGGQMPLHRACRSAAFTTPLRDVLSS